MGKDKDYRSTKSYEWDPTGAYTGRLREERRGTDFRRIVLITLGLIAAIFVAALLPEGTPRSDPAFYN